MKMTKYKINKKTCYFLLGAFLLLFILIISSKIIFRNPAGKITPDANKINWNIYTNKEYSFEIKFPAHWHLFEDFSNNTPIINFYPRSFSFNPPFDHFSGISHVSIYPKGLPMEGVVGTQKDVTESVRVENLLQEDPKRVINFNLHDETVWAQVIQFSDAPKNWDDWGFVWTRQDVIDYSEKCIRNGTEISAFDCNVFDGDEIVRSGTVNESSVKLIEQIISSIKFIK